MNKTYAEIANDFSLWGEYADPSGLDTKESFNSKTAEEKIEFLVACFGPEKQEVES